MNLAPRELPDDDYAWWREVLLAFDCLLNALLRGWHHETLSSRSWRAWSNAKVFGRISRPIIDALFVWQSFRLDHCERHYNAEVARAALIVKARSQ
jgi:hypothetical protein